MNKAANKKTKFSNRLDAGEKERLYILIEEAAEVQQAATKILRHGYGSVHPHGGPNNRENLQKEIGDFVAARDLLLVANDLVAKRIAEGAIDKVESLRQYAHHQPKIFLDYVEKKAERRLAVYRRRK